MRIFIASTLDDRIRLEGPDIAVVAQSDLHSHHICTKHRQTIPVVTPQTIQQHSQLCQVSSCHILEKDDSRWKITN